MANSTKISEYSTTAANNTSIDSIDIDENCAASGINNAIRSVLKHQADAFTQGTPIALDQTNNRVGIGTTSPSVELEIASSAPQMRITDTDTNAVFQINASSTSGGVDIQADATGVGSNPHMAFDVAGSERARIDSSGNVGIGTTSPDKLFHLATTDTAKDMIKMSNGTQDFRFGVNNSSAPYLFTYSNHGIRFGTNSAERMTIDTNGRVGIGDTSPDSMLKVQSVAAVTGNAQLTYFYDSQNRIGNYRQAAHASFSNYMNLMYTNRSGSSAFDFMRMASAGAGDNEFRFRGDGQAYADGSWNGGGADYSEYFEWDDGNSSDEDRRGYSVVLVGNKIRKATSSDAASDIIGVISATPAVTGDAAWERWEGKYLTDDYGSYLKEAYTATAWTETDADGAETHHYYETDKIPADVTVPADAVVTSTEEDGSLLMRRRLNPDFDDTQTYVPREERQEWDTVGLMGKLRLRAGQPTGDRWIKMCDIATDDDGNVTVEEWLVR